MGLISGCDENSVENCVYNQVIYRASFALVLFFGLLAMLSKCSDNINKGMWGFKFLGLFGCFVAFWWGSNEFFRGYAEVARVLSFFWLLVQGLLYLDISHDVHDILLLKATAELDSSGKTSHVWQAIYLVVASGLLTSGIVGLNYLYAEGGYTGCDTGSFFVTLTVVICSLQLFISALNSVNGGVVTPCMMFAYSVFMTWYALLSSPDEECNPTAYQVSDDSDAKRVAIGLVCALSVVLLLFCIVSGSVILQIFCVSGQGVLETAYGGYDTNRGDAEGGAMINVGSS